MSFCTKVAQMLRRAVSPFYFRQMRLSESRRPYTKENFCDYFEALSVDAKIASEVWNALSDSADFDEFRPYPEDDILRVYGLADEDLDDLVLGILNRCQCRVPSPAETASMAPLETVVDLVLFVAQMKLDGYD